MKERKYITEQWGARPTITIFEHIPEQEGPFPAKAEVCHCCRGRGSIVNPSVDGHGLSSEDFAEDPDFAEDYMSGVYDITCPECEGNRVVLMPSTKEGQKAYDSHMREMAQSRAEEEAERRMGC